MVNTIDITDLMSSSGINHTGNINVDDNTSSLEPDPRNDWIHFAIEAFKIVSSQKPEVNSAAFIGSGNGIETIAALKIFKALKQIYVTDVLPEAIYQIEQNIRANCSSELKYKTIEYLAGRDCIPLEKKVDFIYGNLPLIAVDANELDKLKATTTLTDSSAYIHLSHGQDDRLRKYSFLSQLGFLMSAKEKLKEDGLVITLLGARVPYGIIKECFERANLQYRILLSGFKKQSDPEFLKEYCDHERKEGIRFAFYYFEEGIRLLKKSGIIAPGVFTGFSDAKLREILKPVEISAKEAHYQAMSGMDVGHLGHAFEAYL